MARVVPVGPIDPELYAFAKKEAEKAERNPRYVPKKRETPAHTVFYRRVGATVKAFVIDKIAPVWTAIEPQLALPVVQHISPEDIPDDELETKTSNSPAIQILATPESPDGIYVSKHTSNRKIFTNGRADCARIINRGEYDITDGAIIRTAICESLAEVLGVGINFSSTRLDDNTEPFSVVREEYFGHTMLGIEMENHPGLNLGVVYVYGYPWFQALSSLASWYGPVLRKISISLADGTSGAYKKEFIYNYTKNQTASNEKGIIYIAPNKNNFSATQARDISDGILEEITYTQTTKLVVNPEDFGFFYFQEYTYKNGWYFKVKLDNVPGTTTTTSTITSSAGRMTVVPEMVGFDRAGDVYHVEHIEHWVDNQFSPIGYENEENGYGPVTYGARSRFDFQHISRPYLKVPNVEQTEIAVFRNKSEKIISVLLEDAHFAVRKLYCSSEPHGGAALIIADKYVFIDHELGSRFSLYSQYRYGHTCLLDSGLYMIGKIVEGGSTSNGKMCVAFFPNPEPGNKFPIFRIDKHYKNFYLLLPHKNYDLEEPPNQDRFAKAALFAGRNHRCYISFDDGVCIDLTDFSDALTEDPDISAEDWDGKPFDYSPIEEWDDDQNKFDPESAPARRIKRAYAPQWVRAYYDYEDAQ